MAELGPQATTEHDALGRHAVRLDVSALIAVGEQARAIATGAALASHFELWDRPLLQAKLMLLVLVGVLVALHVMSTHTRAVSLGLAATSLLIVWLGVKLTYG